MWDHEKCLSHRIKILLNVNVVRVLFGVKSQAEVRFKRKSDLVAVATGLDEVTEVLRSCDSSSSFSFGFCPYATGY